MTAKILIVEDDVNLREALEDTLQLAGFNTTSAENGQQALALIMKNNYDMVISDVAMDKMNGHELLREVRRIKPDLKILLMTAYADISEAIQAIRAGAVDYLVKPFQPKQLVKQINHFVGTDTSSSENYIAVAKSSKKLFQLAKRVAKSDMSVFVTGASGTGKEIIARYIHSESKRSKHPFIAINCAAIPENMLEATLFGYEKGAFTGAYNAHSGKFEQANHSTLLLDEITEMNLSLQAKLLRVLQENEVERLGSRKVISLDVRVIATSNCNIEEAVNNGKFREDLYYRLNVFPLRTLALKDRKEDIAPLAKSMLTKYSMKLNRPNSTFDIKAIEKLNSHSWPGNVRELDNVVQRALIFQNDEIITSDDIHFTSINLSQIDNTDIIKKSALPNDLKKHEYDLILEKLNEFYGCRKKVAQALGISARTLRYKLAKMRDEGITIP